MSGLESKNSVFQNRSFWLKVGVDYDEVIETTRSEPIDIGEQLLNQFLRRKRKVVKSKYGSIREFKTKVRNSDSPEKLLLSLYAESLWMMNWTEGSEFKHAGEAVEELMAELSSDVDYEDAGDEFGIVWPTESRVRREKKDGEVIGTRPDETNPIIVKKSDSGLKVRASSNSRDDAVDELRNREDIEEVEPDSASERVTGKVQRFLTNEHDEFKIIGVKFNGSELPERSRVRVKNERAIYDDLEALNRHHIISTEGVSEIQKVFLKDNRYGGKYRVKVIHGNDGFRFELESPDKLEEERQRFKERFTSKTGIEFGVIYEYGSQDQRHLFNRTLSGEGEAYDRYFSELDEKYPKYVERLTDVRHRTLKLCLNPSCKTTNSEDLDQCIECGGVEFSDSYEVTDVSLNEGQFSTLIHEQIRNLRPSSAKADFSGWSTSKIQMNSRDVVRTDFHATDYVEGGSSTSTRHEVFFVPQGNKHRPRTVDDYLLKCIYVTFGDSAIADYEGYGRISLFELISSNSLEDLVGKSLHDAIAGTRTRTFRKSLEAYKQADAYLDILEEEDSLTDRRYELEQVYDPTREGYFEKHLFYLLKGLFSQSERWGRTAKKEADGLIVIPRPDSMNDYAAKYDAKLSHNVEGYDLGTEEEDQAARYMSNSAEVKSLRAKTGDAHPSAHILVSQNFDTDDFPRISKGVQMNLSEFSEKERPNLVFMEFNAVIGLFALQSDNHHALDNPSLKNRFRDLILQELEGPQLEQQFIHFNEDSVQNIRDGLLSTIDQYDIETVKTYSK